MAANRVIVRREYLGPGFRVRELQYPPGLRQGAHAHNEDGVTIVLGGGIREAVGGREEIATCLSVVVKPAGVIHADRVGPRGARTLQIVFHRDRVFDLEDREFDLGAWRWIHAGPGARPLIALHRTLRELPSSAGVEDLVLEILGDIEDAGSPGSSPPAWLREIKEALDRPHAEPVRVRDLAAGAGVHPVSLTRAFRRHYGVPLTEYRRRTRVRQAARAIERTDRTLTGIAHACGFSDQPHMCREIRDATGLTPGQLRRLGGRPVDGRGEDSVSSVQAPPFPHP